VRFGAAIVQSPVCVPSRQSMLSGHYCHTVGVTAMGRQAQPMKPGLLDRFESIGMRPMNIGKRHAYDWNRRGDSQPNFSVTGEPTTDLASQRMLGWSRTYPESTTETHGWALGSTVPLRVEEMSTSVLGDTAVDLLRNELLVGADPWFLRVSFRAPHVPCRVPEGFLLDPSGFDLPLPTGEELAAKPVFERNNIREYSGANLTIEQIGRVRGTYYGMVSLVDVQVGKMVTALREAGQLDNTIIAINSDQGFQLGEHGFWKKRCFYEQNVKVPLILSCPNHLPLNRTVAPQVEMVDFVPTLLELVGQDVPEDIAGRSLLPLIRGETSTWRYATFCEHDYTGDMYEELRRGGKHCVMVRTPEWKLVHFVATNDESNSSLYNLADDPGETVNLYGQRTYSSVVTRLKEYAEEWLRTDRVGVGGHGHRR
jgi:arylsulfatase A-like enzyme